MILTTLPDLPPLPETTANAGFRRRFYERWGRENALICGRAVQAEYVAIEQALSIKAAWGGGERYFVGRRDVLVDADNYLVLNQGRRYGSRLAGRRPTFSLAVFVRPGLAGEVAAASRRSLGEALDNGHAVPRRASVEFSEHLRPHHPRLLRRLEHLRDSALAGEESEVWLEQQVVGLLDELITIDSRDAIDAPARLHAVRPATRAELLRRLRSAVDCIESRHAEPLTLADMAQAACLSPYHFVRLFRRHTGLTPYAYLSAKRARVALRLLADGEVDREAVAQRAGFGSRWAMARALSRARRAASAH